jgi:hypothetical protein
MNEPELRNFHIELLADALAARDWQLADDAARGLAVEIGREEQDHHA